MVDLKFFDDATVRIQGFQNRLIEKLQTAADAGQELDEGDQVLFVLSQVAVAQNVIVNKLSALEKKLDQVTPETL